MVTIATWNVNSVKARLPRVVDWLETFKPDVALLQEVKCETDAFPRMEIESLGYKTAVVGQKSYNGVAILSTQPIEIDLEALPEGDGDDHARYLEGRTHGLTVAALYLPNGNPTRDETGGDSQKFAYKLRWMERLIDRAKVLMSEPRPFVLGGDYNVCPTDEDVYDPQAFADDALCRTESRAKYRELMWLGLTDAFRSMDATPHAYSYWDYKAGAWQKDNGLRIDHLLLSPEAADRLEEAGIDRTPRGKEKASDHTPVWCRLAD